MLTAYAQTVYSDATSLVVFQGPPNVVVEWSIVSGGGSIEALSTHTDEFGRAASRYSPDGFVGATVIRCTHGA